MAITMSTTTERRFRAASVALAPLVLMGSFLAHPYIGLGPPDPATVAQAVAADTTRWGLAHIAVGVSCALVAIAFAAIRSYLEEASVKRPGPHAVPFIIFGSTLYAMLPGFEFAPLAAAQTGGNVQAAQAALLPWFLPILMLSAIAFMLGILGFAPAVSQSKALSPRLTMLVVGALVVMAAARFVTFSAVQLYVHGLASLVALWPLAHAMWMAAERPPAVQQPGIPAI